MNQNQLEQMLTEACKKDISSCTDKELYTGLLCLVNKLSKGRESVRGKKKLYYISAEFLIGKLLSNNMINLGIYSQVTSSRRKNQAVSRAKSSLSATEHVSILRRERERIPRVSS